MSFLDDLGEAFSDGADAVVGAAEAVVETVEEAVEDTEEAVDEAMKEVGEWFIEKMQEAVEDFFNDGGTDVGHNEFEERATASGRLEVAQVIPYEYARPFGSDDDELTGLPSPFTSRFSETGASDHEFSGFQLWTDGAIGTVDDISTESDAGLRHSQGRDVITGGSGPTAWIDARERSDHELDFVPHVTDRAISSSGGAISSIDDDTGLPSDNTLTNPFLTNAREDHDLQIEGARLASDGAIGTVDEITTDANAGRRRSPDRSENRDDESEPTGGAGSETREAGIGETLSEARDNGASQDSLQFIPHADAPPAHTPEWTNFNDADPSITLLDGGWIRDADLRPNDDDRSSRREGAFSVETDTQGETHTGFATTLEDASPTLSMSWLF